jgi:hypothetical protein
MKPRSVKIVRQLKFREYGLAQYPSCPAPSQARNDQFPDNLLVELGSGTTHDDVACAAAD